MLTKEEQIAWLAGLLEGEGCFLAAYRGKRIRAILELGSADEDVISKAHTILACGTRMVKFPKTMYGKSFYQVSVFGKPASWWMVKLLPYMGERRQTKIEEILKKLDESEVVWDKTNIILAKLVRLYGEN